MEKNCEFTPSELLASIFLSVVGRSTGDYELKKKIRESDMTIETITILLHEHMLDRLNDSNNSNDGREIKHVQGRPYKRKCSEDTSQEKAERKPRNQKFKWSDNQCGQCGVPKWITQHVSPAKTAECRNCKRKGQYEKLCRSLKRVQYMERATSSAEEDNWEYDKIQNIYNTKHKKGFYHATIG